MSEVQTLSVITRVLHALIALGMISLLAIGIYMEEFEVFALYDWHKSFGFLVLILATVRVLWRIKKGWPSAIGNTSAIQQLVAKVIHWVLIIATVLYPLSGVMMSVGGGHGLHFFGVELFAENLNVAGETIAINEGIAGLGHQLHGTLTWFVIAVIVLHIVGALKHHFLDRDATISRMFFGR